MASSRITLDIDNLTFETLYIKNANIVTTGSKGCGTEGRTSSINISSYTIPIIPGNCNIRNEFKYFTPDQMFSTANILLTPSSIPDVLAGIQSLSSVQVATNLQVSSISTSLGYQIYGFISTTNLYQSSVYGVVYTSSYSTFYKLYSSVQLQNSTTSQIILQLNTLGNSLSTLSTLVTCSFSTLGTYLDTRFDQSQSVSSLSTYT